jgi:hypothetical protein
VLGNYVRDVGHTEVLRAIRKVSQTERFELATKSDGFVAALVSSIGGISVTGAASSN